VVSFFRSVTRSLKLLGMFVVAGTELAIKRPATRPARADWLNRFCARAIKGLGVEITVVGNFPGKGAVIANHLSYLDIVVFAALRPCVFVSKLEIKDWPVVGWMTTMAGTVYVERGHGGSAVRAKGRMQSAMEAGLPVVFFPEGTTSNGEQILKFHSGLLGQMLDVGAPVTAAYLRYSLGDGNGAGVRVKDDVCYWGDTSMWPHVFRLLGLKNIRTEVWFADEPIAFASEELQRKKAAVVARAAVRELKDKVEAVSQVGLLVSIEERNG
jgi:1-acyl-sn-glycerol-3-phosphate acyltransferase